MKKKEREKSRNRKTFVSFRRFVSIPFELTNWVNLSIIFDLFGVLCIQTIGDYHKLCSRVRKRRRRRGEEKENFFPCIHTLRIHFSDQTNTRGRKSSQRIHKKKKGQIKDVLSEFISPCSVSREKSVFESHVLNVS